MRKLTENEIKFIKETNFTPTVFQHDEYKRTSVDSFEQVKELAKDKYDFDIYALLNKFFDEDDIDGISIENNATYLLYTFFSKDELEKLSDKEALRWLQDFKYHYGFRKWNERQARHAIEEALEVYDGKRVFYITYGSHVWNMGDI